MSFNLLWLIAIPIVKIAINLPCVWYLRRISNQYRSFTIETPENYCPLLRSKSRTIHLLKDAGICNGARPVSFGLGIYSHESAFSTYPSTDHGTRTFMLAAMEQAIGVYQSRAIDAINPIYWLKLLVFLPGRALSAIGVNQTSIASRILQFLYWLALAALAVCFPQTKSFFLYLRDMVGS